MGAKFPLLAPPSFPPQRGEDKDKLLTLEGLGVGLYCISMGNAINPLVFLNIQDALIFKFVFGSQLAAI
jgi:hypothetical protein